MTLEDLKKIAEAATSGPYRIDDGIIQYEHSDYDYPDEKYWSDLGVWKTTRGTIKFWPSDAKYIATFYPELILALLEECIAAREISKLDNQSAAAKVIENAAGLKREADWTKIYKELYTKMQGAQKAYDTARAATDKILGELK